MSQSDTELVNRIIKYFKEKYNHTLSEEEAVICLANLADLFLAFAEIEEEKMVI